MLPIWVITPNGESCSAANGPAVGGASSLEVRPALSHESCRMDNTTRYEIIGEGQYRVLAQGWWADVEYRWDRATDDWRVMIVDTNAYGRISLFDMALAVNDVIGGGEVPREKLVWADTGGRLIDGRAEW